MAKKPVEAYPVLCSREFPRRQDCGLCSFAIWLHFLLIFTWFNFFPFELLPFLFQVIFPRAEGEEVSVADEELLCKPVCVDLPVGNPEHLDCGFALPTYQAPLSTLHVKALGLRLGVVWRSMLDNIDIHLLVEAFGNQVFAYACRHLCSRLPHLKKVGRARGTILAHAASVVVDLELVQYKIPRMLWTVVSCRDGFCPSVDILFLLAF